MPVTSRDIGIPFIIGLLANTISAYLFTLRIINLTILLFIIISSLFVIILIMIGLKLTEITKELNKQKLEQQKTNERFKIYGRISKLETEVFKNG